MRKTQNLIKKRRKTEKEDEQIRLPKMRFSSDIREKADQQTSRSIIE